MAGVQPMAFVFGCLAFKASFYSSSVALISAFRASVISVSSQGQQGSCSVPYVVDPGSADSNSPSRNERQQHSNY